MRATRTRKLISIRRILGVSVFAYAALHFALYIVNQHFKLSFVASEIVSRLYLTLGFIGFCGLCALAATSFDQMIAKLGADRWARLQQGVYAITALAVVHFFMQAKQDVSEPILMGGIFALLGGYRIAHYLYSDLSIWQVGVLGCMSAVATALAEAIWYHFSAHAPFDLVLESNLDFSDTLRPAWYVLGAGLVVLIARSLRSTLGGRKAKLSYASARTFRLDGSL
jgi:sulfoxide reductase heme-binding subunit YedZ